MSDKPTYEELARRVRELEDVEAENQRTRMALQQKMRELETFIGNIPHMAWLKDTESNFILTNQAFGDAVGMDPGFLRSHTCAVCFGEEAAGKFKADDQKVMAGRTRVEIEETITDVNGNTVYLETTKSPIIDEAGVVVGTVGIAVDITERKRMQEKLIKLATQDHLTGLYNRSALDEHLVREIERASRHERPISLMIMDIDNFKKINDTFMHHGGDKLLCQVASILQDTVRTTDLVARFGGDEFVVILPETSASEAQELAERLRALVSGCELVVEGGEAISCTISVGIACFPTHGRSPSDLFVRADAALYSAKERGRNCVYVQKTDHQKR